jgi:hypothetical protein
MTFTSMRADVPWGQLFGRFERSTSPAIPLSRYRRTQLWTLWWVTPYRWATSVTVPRRSSTSFAASYLSSTPQLHQPLSRLPLQGPHGQESRLGGGVKHLVELSKVRWNCVNHQPEPIRKSITENRTPTVPDSSLIPPRFRAPGSQKSPRKLLHPNVLTCVQLTVLVHTEPRVFCRSLSYGVWPPRPPCGRLKL